MNDERLAGLRAQRLLLCRQLALLDTAIAAESGAGAFLALPDGLASSGDERCRANGLCGLTLADLREMSTPPREPLAGAN